MVESRSTAIQRPRDPTSACAPGSPSMLELQYAAKGDCHLCPNLFRKQASSIVARHPPTTAGLHSRTLENIVSIKTMIDKTMFTTTTVTAVTTTDQLLRRARFTTRIQRYTATSIFRTRPFHAPWCWSRATFNACSPLNYHVDGGSGREFRDASEFETEMSFEDFRDRMKKYMAHTGAEAEAHITGWPQSKCCPGFIRSIRA
jgi:hypothetical protein